MAHNQNTIFVFLILGFFVYYFYIKDGKNSRVQTAVPISRETKRVIEQSGLNAEQVNLLIKKSIDEHSNRVESETNEKMKNKIKEFENSLNDNIETNQITLGNKFVLSADYEESDKENNNILHMMSADGTNQLFGGFATAKLYADDEVCIGKNKNSCINEIDLIKLRGYDPTNQRTVNAQKIKLGNKFLLSGDGDAIGNDDMLRLMKADGSNQQFGGFSANKLMLNEKLCIGDTCLDKAKLDSLINNLICFDSDYYLAQNPDVKKAGLDPLNHYLTYGKNENRKWGVKKC